MVSKVTHLIIGLFILYFFLPLATAQVTSWVTYDDFDDGVLNTTKFNFMRGTSCGATAWQESNGVANASCDNGANFRLGVQVKNLYDWNITALNFTLSYIVPSDPNAFFKIGFANLTGATVDDGTNIPFAGDTYNAGGGTTTATNIQILWGPNTTAIRISNSSTFLKGIAFNGTAIPTIAMTSGGGQRTYIELRNVSIQGIVFASLDPNGNANYLSNSNINFSTSVISNSNQLKNISLFIDGAFYQNISISGTSNTSSFSKVFDTEGLKNYNFLACTTNHVCQNSSTQSVNISSLVFDAINYTVNVSELSIENYYVNISTTYTFISGSIIYNGTAYSSNVLQIGNQYQVSNQLTAPEVTSVEKKNLYWSFFFNNGTATIQVNTTVFQQNILPLSVDNCGTNTIKLINYTLYDEKTKVKLGVSQNISIESDLLLKNAIGQVLVNVSKNTTQNTMSFCISQLPSSTFYLFSQVRYSADEYVNELFFQEYYPINANYVGQNISLFDIKSAESTLFRVTVNDQNVIPLEGGLISLKRKYIANGTYEIVEQPKTDYNGKANLHIDTNSYIYSIDIIQNGAIIYSINDVVFQCDGAGNCEVIISIEDTTGNFENFNNYRNLTYTLSTYPSSRNVTVTFNSLNGTSRSISLQNYLLGGNLTSSICTSNTIAVTGTITCNIPISYGNQSVITYLYVDNTLIETRTWTPSISPQTIFGYLGSIAAVFIILTIVFMFSQKMELMIMGAILGFAVAGTLYFIDTSSFIGVGSILIMLVVVGGALIWKLQKE